ncbi:pyruvate kinase 1, cytosolic-like isoform X13 [Cucumis melo]|uniref:pyruvate kinase n=1 Tax=Cucumis melo TaxID=3656 RepID=A0ABM3LCG0_CUCME|nr:pyruvate kinase 1, cytosolic-like isoform X13 [Cucumis melo]
MTKIVGTLGPNSRSVQVISACLMAGMSVAQFDFSWGSPDYHQVTLENLKIAVKSTKKLCAVMLDTAGPEVLVVTKVKFISLQKDGFVVLTPNQELEASSELLPINYGGLSKARQFLSKLGDLNQTQIFAKIESVEVFLFQKTALYRCNMAGKPDVLTRVVDSMTNNLRPTRAVATDVANAVLDALMIGSASYTISAVCWRMIVTGALSRVSIQFIHQKRCFARFHLWRTNCLTPVYQLHRLLYKDYKKIVTINY